MSSQATAKVWKVKNVSDTQRLVMLALAEYTNPDNECWPKVSTIAKMIDKSERTVQRAINSLEKKGMVRKEERTRKNGSSTSNLYTLTVGEGDTAMTPPPRHSYDTPQGDTAMSPPITNIKKEPIKSLHEVKTSQTKAILDAFGKEVRITNYGMAGKAAKQLAKDGYTPGQVMQCYGFLKKDPFWRDKPVTLAIVNKHIESFLKATQPSDSMQVYAEGSHKFTKKDIIHTEVDL